VSKAKNATFLFQRDFMEYHQDRFEDHSLMVYKNDKLLAILPANKKEDTLYSHQGLTYGGLVVDHRIKLNIFATLFQEVLRYLNERGILKLEIKLLPSIYANLPNDELLYLMFILDSKLMKRDTLSAVDLNANLNFSKNRIEGFKRANKHELVLKEGDFDSFWNTLLVPNLRKKYQSSPVHSLSDIKLLRENFPKNIRQFNVYYNDEIVAGTTVFETDRIAHLQYIASEDRRSKLGSLDFLHMQLIKNVFADKSYFDFGISNENQGKTINSGLMLWKEGFGARTVTQDCYSINTENYKNIDSIFI